MNGLSVYVKKDELWGNSLGVWLVERDDNGKPTNYVKSVVSEPLPEAYYVSETFRIAFDEAQRLMDQLWDCGLRPSEGSGSAGAMAATQRHLEDMRRIAFDALKAETNYVRRNEANNELATLIDAAVASSLRKRE